MQLYELARPDHPILQLLLRNAPGTYQHSLQVANLAEQAAREIGANPLLTRVGALYHDAGKAVRPQFYIENQLPDQNVHEQLDPTTSAGIILSHVQEGLDLARKHRLPPIIQNFISEHHGTMRASYQYHAALESVQGDESELDARDFTYPGPRPQSRETALLMLADGVEAKARADTPDDEDALDELVHTLIKDRLDRGQLDNTELTLRDLEIIRHSFVNTLKGIHHPRIRYPSVEDDAQQDAQASNTPSPTTPQEP
jgi:putative nucleotidyltransferase with HDIG domain